MPKYTLQPNEEKTIPTSGKFLSIVNASNSFKIQSPEIGVVVGEVNRQYVLDSIREVVFVNDKATAIDIEWETSNIEIRTGNKGAVSINGEVVVSRIVEAIQVTADATVENGKMSQLTANNFAEIPVAKTSVGAGQTVEVLASRAALNRAVILQSITVDADGELLELRVGSTSQNAPNGLFMKGNEDAPAQLVLETETAVFVHNPHATKTVTIAGCEQWRA